MNRAYKLINKLKRLDAINDLNKLKRLDAINDLNIDLVPIISFDKVKDYEDIKKLIDGKYDKPLYFCGDHGDLICSSIFGINKTFITHGLILNMYLDNINYLPYNVIFLKIAEINYNEDINKITFEYSNNYFLKEGHLILARVYNVYSNPLIQDYNLIYKVLGKKEVETYLHRNKHYMTEYRVRKDLDYLYHEDVLTSRLAIIIYKLATFDLQASDKKIGLFFQYRLGKSKLFNNRKYMIVNVKGYDIKMAKYTYNIENALYNRKGCRINNQIIEEIIRLKPSSCW